MVHLVNGIGRVLTDVDDRVLIEDVSSCANRRHWSYLQITPVVVTSSDAPRWKLLVMSSLKACIGHIINETLVMSIQGHCRVFSDSIDHNPK